MNVRQTFRRLFWKEFRECRMVVLIAFAAPAVLFSVAHEYADSALESVLSVSTAFAMYILLVVWASLKGDAESHGYQFSMKHLPISPIATWASSMLISLVIVACIGGWFGYWSSLVNGSSKILAVECGAIEFLAIYAFGYYFASAFSKWLAIAIGVLHIAAGGSLIQALDLSVSRDADSLAVIGCVAAGAVIASLVFVWLANKKSLQTRQAVSVIIMLVVAIMPSFRSFAIYNYHRRSGSPISLNVMYMASNHMDRSVYVERYGEELVFYNTRTSKSARLAYIESTVSIGIYDRSVAYLLRHLPNDNIADILRWDTSINEITTVCSIPVRRSLDYVFISQDTIDPTGRFAMFQVRALLGNGEDLWLVNLETGKAKLISPCITSRDVEQIGWSKKTATILRSNGGFPYEIAPVRIDLTTMKTKHFTPLNKRS